MHIISSAQCLLLRAPFLSISPVNKDNCEGPAYVDLTMRTNVYVVRRLLVHFLAAQTPEIITQKLY